MGYEEKDNYGKNGSGYGGGGDPYAKKDNYGHSRYGNSDPYPNKYGGGGGKKSGGSSILPWVGVAAVLGIYLNYLS